jgi:hypothetical protein
MYFFSSFVALVRGKFIDMSTHIRKLDYLSDDNLSLKLLEKQEKANFKSNRWKEIIKMG